MLSGFELMMPNAAVHFPEKFAGQLTSFRHADAGATRSPDHEFSLARVMPTIRAEGRARWRDRRNMLAAIHESAV